MRSAVVVCARLRYPAILLLAFLGATGGLLESSRAQAPTDVPKPIELGLRIAWGSGTARQWRGRLWLSEGRFGSYTQLALEPDAPGSLVNTGSELRIVQPSPRAYDGVDVLVTAPLTATLTVELATVGQRGEVRRFERPVAELVQQFHNEPLDELNNRLLIRRAPGDRLRVGFARDNLVFSPGDRFAFDVQPHLPGAAAESATRCQVRLVRLADGEVVWTQQRDLRRDAEGTITGLNDWSLEAPAREGVYDLDIGLYQRRLTDRFLNARPVVHRKVQLVVIEHQPKAVANKPWKLVTEIDPASPDWWDRVTRISKLLPGMSQQPVSNGKAREQTIGGRKWITLAPGGWQAYPLAVDRAGRPHVIEVEFPDATPQALGISVVEPNSAGQLVPIGLDSGVMVSPRSDESAPNRVQTHRLVVWPKTKTPMLLLTNRNGHRDATFGKLRVLGGPTRLPVPESPAPVGSPGPRVEGRLLSAYFDKPLFPENFSAPEALDERTQRSLDDWQTFYEGGRRLVEYLKYAGYNSATITVACEGSSIYPSRLLTPTPKYDTGLFFMTGQDPVRKDVLEMLLRLFDREGLKLVPAIQFAAPLPQLEQLRRTPGQPPGLSLTDHQNVSWVARHGTRSGLAPYYNPLDERVQKALRAVVGELLERYSHHESFGGLAIQMGPDTYVQLPGAEWATDSTTVKRFQQEQQLDVPAASDRPLTLLGPTVRPLWTRWRARRLAEFFKQLHRDLAQQRRDARLFLLTADLVTSFEVRRQMLPRLPSRLNVDTMMLEVGVDAEQYRDTPGIGLLRPRRQSPGASLVAQAVNLDIAGSAEFDRYFGRGAVLYHEPLPLRLPEFDAASPFGAENTYTWLVPEMVRSGARSRQRFVESLAAADVESLLDGGWMLPMGQEVWQRSIFNVFRRLPAARFETVAPANGRDVTQPVVVRRLSQGERTYVYVVNPSPWPVSVELDLDAPVGCQLEMLGAGSSSGLLRNRERTVWRVDLRPYDLTAALLSARDVSVARWQVTLPATATARLQRRLSQVGRRVNAVPDGRTMPALTNPGFELEKRDIAIPGWLHARGPGIQVDVDPAQKFGGGRSLKISRTRADGLDAWVRSDPFPPPETGRLRISVRLRVEDPKQQPRLRLAVEGRLDGRTYYRYAAVGADNPQARLRDRWAEYQFVVNDLPLRGLNDFRIGFDLMSEGEVWIDDVQTFDLWLDDTERAELLKRLALASYHLDANQPGDTLTFLDSYWPRFLQRQVPLPADRGSAEPRTARVPPEPRGRTAPATPSSRPPVEPSGSPMPPPAAEPPRTRPAASPTSTTPPRQTVLDRLRNWVPRRLNPFQSGS